MTMSIADDKVVTFHYSVRAEDGSFAESSAGQEPAIYLHGRGNIIPGLEAELAGKRSGDKFSAVIPPERAYGPRDPNARGRVPIKHLIRPGKLAPGKTVHVNTNAGPRAASVLKVGRFNVDLDFNHPLAGKTLAFDIEVVDVRDATAEELAHGHAHRPGAGHEHP